MANPQQFNLRWNNHTNNLTKVFLDHYENEKMVDVTLSCEGKFLKAHKIVLGACSPYLQEIFDRHGSTLHPVIILNGLKFEDVRLMVEFMYKGEVMVTESSLDRLLKSAENLQIKGLSNVRPSKDGTSPISNGNVSSNSNGIPQSLNVKSSNDPRFFCTQPEASPGTPAHLKRKRVKLNKDKDSGGGCLVKNDISSQAMAISNLKNESDIDDDLPITIKIDPPLIRDIDEDEENAPLEWDTSKEINESDGGNPDPIEMRLGGKGSSSVNEISSSFSGTSAYESRMTEPKEKIPRPPNAFMIFANEYRRKLATQFPNESNKDISIRLGVMWKNLETKEDYYTASRLANDEHKKKYPDYYYSPKEARIRKKWKQQQQQNQSTQFIAQYNPVHLVKVFMNEESGEIRQKSTTVHTNSN